jgi:hypothetical protein
MLVPINQRRRRAVAGSHLVGIGLGLVAAILAPTDQADLCSGRNCQASPGGPGSDFTTDRKGPALTGKPLV